MALANQSLEVDVEKLYDESVVKSNELSYLADKNKELQSKLAEATK